MAFKTMLLIKATVALDYKACQSPFASVTTSASVMKCTDHTVDFFMIYSCAFYEIESAMGGRASALLHLVK